MYGTSLAFKMVEFEGGIYGMKKVLVKVNTLIFTSPHVDFDGE